MSEPASSTILHAGTSVTGGFVVMLGPILGPWAAVLAASFVGALWTLGAVETTSLVHGFLLVLRTMLTALILTGMLAAALVSYTDIPLDYVLPATAFAIGALSDKFGVLKAAVVRRLESVVGGGSAK